MFNIFTKKVNLNNTHDITEINETVDQIKDKYDIKKIKLKFNRNNILAVLKMVIEEEENINLFDEQLDGALEILNNNIIQMETGEGKTYVGIMAAICDAILHRDKQIFVITTNEYLVKRDFDLAKKIGKHFNVEINYNSEMKNIKEKEEAYKANIIYTTMTELAYDYLKENMKANIKKFQKEHFKVIIDEIDFILIDSAKMPIGINEFKNIEKTNLIVTKQISDELIKNVDFDIDFELNQIELTESGISKIEEKLAIDNLYSLDNVRYVNEIEHALMANFLFKKDVDYIVEDNKIVQIDKTTGRKAIGRVYQYHLQNALEVKENIPLSKTTKTISTITVQNFIKKFEHITGMSGTAKEAAPELFDIYGVETKRIKRHVPSKRIDHKDKIFLTIKGKHHFLINKVIEKHKKGVPILIATETIEEASKIAHELKLKNIIAKQLNAKNHKLEAEIIKNAGLPGNVTIAANMAGRGTDIKLQENAEELGGMLVISTTINPSERINSQIRGRVSRQGEPGETQFLMSIEDPILKNNLGKMVKNLTGDNPDSLETIESAIVKKQIYKILKEEDLKSAEIRKTLLDYDDVLNKQRDIIYKNRNNFIEIESENLVERYLQKYEDYAKFYIDRMFYDYDFELNSKEQNLEFLVKLFKDANIQYECRKILEDNYHENEEEMKNTVLKYMMHMQKIIFETLIEVFEEQGIDFNIILKELSLNVIAAHWEEHLDSMEVLRRGILLRQLNNKNPLEEYKRESYILFKNSLDLTKMSLFISYNNLSKL